MVWLKLWCFTFPNITVLSCVRKKLDKKDETAMGKLRRAGCRYAKDFGFTG